MISESEETSFHRGLFNLDTAGSAWVVFQCHLVVMVPMSSYKTEWYITISLIDFGVCINRRLSMSLG